MTTFEHALLGINGAIATGFYRRPHGWKWVATAGVAAIGPDWDGLPMLIDMSRFEAGHRVWGHNFLACAILATLIVVLVVRFDGWERLIGLHPGLRRFSSPIDAQKPSQTAAWWMMAWVAAMSQIPADILVSGGEGLTDWPLQPAWPFSDWSVVYPMVPWGNVGVTLIFATGMIAMAKRPERMRMIAIASIVVVAGYLVFWGTVIR